MSKEYDRLRAKRTYEDFKKRKNNLVVNVFNGKCFLCSAEHRKGFHLHHVFYHAIESNYPRNSKAMSTRLKRLAEAEKNPERFRLLCPKCHILLESLKALIDTVDLKKLKEIL